MRKIIVQNFVRLDGVIFVNYKRSGEVQTGSFD